MRIAAPRRNMPKITLQLSIAAVAARQADFGIVPKAMGKTLARRRFLH
jgi:hypothetical protein